MGLFKDIKGARGTKGGLYFVPGNYLVLINRCKLGETRKGIDFFVAETKVVWSDVEERKPGSEPSYMVTMDKDPALGNVADFMRAGLACKAVQQLGATIEDIGEIDEIELSEEEAEEIVGEANPLAGVVMALNAFNKPTAAGKDFTRVKWAIPTDEDLAKAGLTIADLKAQAEQAA
jgi:hypothetical protein